MPVLPATGTSSVGRAALPAGSLGITCNQFDGQCDCQQEKGGRDCSQCEDLYWGDPKVQCTACDCNGQGSADMQCDRRTGQCVSDWDQWLQV
eukprot:XP_019920048.1 PREDICTED: laminin subunit B [Crassostrea gigas]